MKVEELPKFPSSRFTIQNYGAESGDGPPWYIDRKTGELKHWSSPYTPVGWTDNPPFQRTYMGKEWKCIAIMFEDQEFQCFWWHYDLNTYELL